MLCMYVYVYIIYTHLYLHKHIHKGNALGAAIKLLVSHGLRLKSVQRVPIHHSNATHLGLPAFICPLKKSSSTPGRCMSVSVCLSVFFCLSVFLCLSVYFPLRKISSFPDEYVSSMSVCLSFSVCLSLCFYFPLRRASAFLMSTCPSMSVRPSVCHMPCPRPAFFCSSKK